MKASYNIEEKQDNSLLVKYNKSAWLGIYKTFTLYRIIACTGKFESIINGLELFSPEKRSEVE